MKTDVVIVGAGFAGASTAFHLSRSFSGSILIVDKETVPGFHASGRNASLVLQSTLNPDLRQVLSKSCQAYVKHQELLGFNQQGSILLGNKKLLKSLEDPNLIPSEYIDIDKVLSQIPLLRGHLFEAALWTPSDGIMDISALLQFYLSQAQSRGTKLWLNCSLLKISGTGPYQLQTTQGTIETRHLINAAGAWASEIGRLAKASAVPLASFKRHLFVLGGIAPIELHWPFVWNQDKNFYFRPESGDLLFSLCDEEKSTHFETSISTNISQSLAELVWLELPTLREATQKKVWSCFRTKTPDGSFVIGWDSVAESFFWVAGLGGHGMGASWQIGKLASEYFLNSTADTKHPFVPDRFEKK